MSGSVSYSCVWNCHRTFAIPQNLCTLGQAAFWYEEGISKLVSQYNKCLNVQGRWRYVIKPAYYVPFLLSINIFVWQNVLYFPNVFHIWQHKIRKVQCVFSHLSLKTILNTPEWYCISFQCILTKTAYRFKIKSRHVLWNTKLLVVVYYDKFNIPS